MEKLAELPAHKSELLHRPCGRTLSPAEKWTSPQPARERLLVREGLPRIGQGLATRLSGADGEGDLRPDRNRSQGSVAILAARRSAASPSRVFAAKTGTVPLDAEKGTGVRSISRWIRCADGAETCE